MSKAREVANGIARAAGGGTDNVFYENNTTITSSYTITAGDNAVSAGPIIVSDEATVTVGANSLWVVV